jgi:hypothetical protein
VLLYDSDNPDFIPDGVAAAGYCDGYAAAAWSARGWSRFPNAIRIAVFATTDDGHALDVEMGNATPNQTPNWVQRRRAAGILRPWVYCNRSNRPAVEGALAAAGILSDQVALWVATLDGTQIVSAGPYPVAAVQYANAAMSGGHYDLSIVNEVFGPGAGTLGGDVTPDEHLWLQIVKTSVIGPPPTSVVGHTDADLLNIFNTTSNADIITAFGQAGYTYMYKLAHMAQSPNAAEPPETEPTKLSGTFSGTLS